MDDERMLVPESGESEYCDEGQEEEAISKNFLRLGITQLVLGLAAMIAGIVIAATWPDWGVDRTGEGVWCGVLVMICGALAVTARFHLYTSVVICNFASNIITAVALSAGIVTASWSTFRHINLWVVDMIKFIPVNALMIASMVLCVYLAIVFGKVLNQKTRINCCPDYYEAMTNSGYAMVYVPPGTHSNPPGAYIAVHENVAAHPQESAKI